MRRSLATLVVAAVVALGACDDDGSSGPPPEHQSAASACARLSRCFDFQDGSSSGVDVCTSVVLARRGFPYLDATSVEACVDAASGCAEMGRCINGDRETQSCDPATTDEACSGSLGERCLGVVVAQDCAAVGGECVEDTVGQLWCGESGTCGESRCEGSGAVNCTNEVMTIRDCGEGSCEVQDGWAHCVGEGEPCEGYVFRCEGNVAVSCDYGRIHRERCAVCSDIDGAFCTAADQCESSRCEGTVLVACVDGVPHETDCAAIGASACEEAGGPRCVE